MWLGEVHIYAAYTSLGAVKQPRSSGSSYLLVKAQVPISIFFAGPVGEMSKSKMSIGRPSVMQAFGI